MKQALEQWLPMRVFKFETLTWIDLDTAQARNNIQKFLVLSLAINTWKTKWRE